MGTDEDRKNIFLIYLYILGESRDLWNRFSLLLQRERYLFFFSFRSVCLLRKWKKNKTLDGTWHFVLVCNRCVAQDSNEVGRVLVLGSVE